jgi:Stress responsive A/B Barrel Domain
MITHIVMLGLSDSTTEEQRERIIRSIEELRPKIPEVRALTVYSDLGWFAGNADIAVVVLLSSRDDHTAYEAHPAHKSVEQLIAPFVTSRVAVQAEAPDSARAGEEQP